MKTLRPSCTILVLTAASAMAASAFQMPRHHHHGSRSLLMPSPQRVGVLEMAAGGGGNSGNNNKVSKRRRRKRKKADSATAPPSSRRAASEKAKATTDTDDDERKRKAAAMGRKLLAQEQMMFDEEDQTFTPLKLEDDDRIAAAAAKAGFSVDGGAGLAGDTQLEDLFDSREFLQRRREKQMEDVSTAGKPSSVIPTKKKIKRSDIKEYEKLMEMDPLADQDDSYFEDEGIDMISAWLGDVEPGVGNDMGDNANKSEKRTSFLGFGTGPLQVGHFIGATVVILMAFVEYPGFPLTNLPTPLRGALQGGLGTIYLINSILAVFSAISAPSRKQSSLLWAAKTFAVGGIAYDQLMQIPTPEELVERAKKEEEMAKRRSGRRGRWRQK